MKYQDQDGKCLVCNRTDKHLHTADQVQQWNASVEDSMSRHPARRRLRPVQNPR